MAGISLAQAEAQLAAYLAASLAVSSGQSYEIAGRRLVRANADEIQTCIDRWDARVKALSAAASGRGRSRTISPGF